MLATRLCCGLACLPTPTPRPDRQNSVSSTEKGRTKEGAEGGLELDALVGRRARVPRLEVGLPALPAVRGGSASGSGMKGSRNSLGSTSSRSRFSSAVGFSCGSALQSCLCPSLLLRSPWPLALAGLNGPG